MTTIGTFQTPPEQADAARVQAALEADNELRVLANVVGVLATLSPDERARVMAYLVAKWGPK